MTQDPAARAAVLSDLARTTWDGFSDGAGAQVYLDQALALVPDHLPAILAIADIHYKDGQWELAEKRLTEASRRLRNQPQQAAKLFQRLAEVHEKLGKLDEAYRQLVEADRMGPGQLLTKLLLGENRYRAGRWREASLHLSALADHPDAAMYPEEVADALAHAAQAEIKLRHPERAIQLYESALRSGAVTAPPCARSPSWRSSVAKSRRPSPICAASRKMRAIARSGRRSTSSSAICASSSRTSRTRCWRSGKR